MMAGAGVLTDMIQVRKRFGYPFLRPLWWSYLFLTLALLTGVVSEYLLVNFFADIFQFKNSIYLEITDPFASVFFTILVYFLIVLDRTFLEKPPLKNLKGLFACFVVFFILRMVIGLLVSQPVIVLDILDIINIGILSFVFVLAYGVLIHFILAARRLEDRDRAEALRTFGIFYLIGCSSIFVSAIFAGPYHGLIRVSIFLLLAVFPFFWYRRYLPRFGNAVTRAVTEADLGAICEKCGVSARQREIIELLLHGKSNRDIAETLFIAPHTVKNHIYNLYQKLGVKSRFELVNYVLEQAKK